MSETVYTADHEWIRDEGDGVYTIGITDYAQNQLGDIVFLDLPEVGRAFESGEAIAEIESTKSVGELYAPADGEVVAVNEAVVDDTSMVNSDAEGEGWLIKARIADLGETLDADAYQKLTSR